VPAQAATIAAAAAAAAAAATGRASRSPSPPRCTMSTPVSGGRAGRRRAGSLCAALLASQQGLKCAQQCTTLLEGNPQQLLPPLTHLPALPPPLPQPRTWAAPTPPLPPTRWLGSSACRAAASPLSPAQTSTARRSRWLRRSGAWLPRHTVTTSQPATSSCGAT
jgi:hypothetical protein